MITPENINILPKKINKKNKKITMQSNLILQCNCQVSPEEFISSNFNIEKELESSLKYQIWSELYGDVKKELIKIHCKINATSGLENTNIGLESARKDIENLIGKLEFQNNSNKILMRQKPFQKFVQWLEDHFSKLRFSKHHHLGLGDIRLTLGQQDAIISLAKKAIKKDNCETK